MLARPRVTRAQHRATLIASGWLAAGALLSACTYDVDKIFEYGQPQDGGSGGGPDAGDGPLPAHLIDLWPEGNLSAACVACAKTQCAEENTSCRDDEECAALTRCVAQTDNPADQNDCRAEHVEWLTQSIQERDIGGPYQQCVFLSRCGNECDSHAQLACAGNFNWPMTSGSAEKIPLHLRFVEGLSATPVAGLTVRACRAETPSECQGVDAEEVSTDENGVVHLEVTPVLGSFQGYLELSGAGIYPTLLRFGWPVAVELVTNVAVISRASVSALVFNSGVELDDDRGLLQLRAFGCNGISSRDVSFSVMGGDDTSKTWYTVGQDLAPVFEATATADRGAGGIVNVPAGRRQVTATHDGETVTQLSAPVRAGHMTIIVMLPDG
jgi:hypothetical protein